MPSYTFGDSENKTFELIPPGDRILEVVKVEFGLSQGAKTRGSDTIELRLRVDGQHSWIDECLIEHESCWWRIDTFLKSMNLLIDGKPLVKGTGIDFSEQMLVGLRGWATVRVEEFLRRDGTKGKSNKVAVWITNKEKLTKVIPAFDPDDDIPF